jgi:hypothetical protein
MREVKGVVRSGDVLYGAKGKEAPKNISLT